MCMGAQIQRLPRMQKSCDSAIVSDQQAQGPTPEKDPSLLFRMTIERKTEKTSESFKIQKFKESR